MRITLAILIITVGLCCADPIPGISSPVIDRVTVEPVQDPHMMLISGSGFALQQHGAEIIADYGHGFLYALKPESWSDKAIRVHVPDLGKSLHPSLYIRTAQGTLSHAYSLQLHPYLVLETSPVFEHGLQIGEKGEDSYLLPDSVPACGQAGTLFYQARIDVKKSRFAKAKLITAPEPYCQHCKPVTVRWYNEPTGFIQYHVVITKRVIQGVCSQRKKGGL